jgi:hypothetical protein
MSIVREKLIASGVRSLREFGYPTASEENILTDPLFSAFFKSQLEEAHEQLKDAPGKLAEGARLIILEMISECVGLGG